jgi:type VI protein secretion system component Hcp
VASGLNRVGCAKDSKTLKYLGTTSLDAVVAHIQAKMDRYNAQHTGETQMSFANVELDHIKPVQRFALELSHYTNIQPMLKEANRRKAAKWSDLDETFWRANIQHQPAFTDIYGGGGRPPRAGRGGLIHND